MTDPTPVRLAAGSGVTFGVDDLSCAAATDLGLWRDEGLEPSWTPVHGGVRAIEALLDGRVDVAYGGLGPALAARAGGAPVRIVVSMARALAQNLVVQSRMEDPDRLRGCSWGSTGSARSATTWPASRCARWVSPRTKSNGARWARRRSESRPCWTDRSTSR